MRIEPAVRTSVSTSSASVKTSRAKPAPAENAASPLTGSAWQAPQNINPIRIRPAASDDGPPRQRPAACAEARPSDQNPAAALRAIPSPVFRFNCSQSPAGRPRTPFAPSSLELAIYGLVKIGGL